MDTQGSPNQHGCPPQLDAGPHKSDHAGDMCEQHSSLSGDTEAGPSHNVTSWCPLV
jgi:hypothetical protein